VGLGLARSVTTTKITRIVEEPQVEAEVTGSVVAALFGLGGFRVLAAADAGGELEVLVETVARVVPCPDCGTVAQAKDRRAVWVGDLPIGGRPVVVWSWASIRRLVQGWHTGLSFAESLRESADAVCERTW
jgi:hypothetical protein